MLKIRNLVCFLEIFSGLCIKKKPNALCYFSCSKQNHHIDFDYLNIRTTLKSQGKLPFFLLFKVLSCEPLGIIRQ